MAAGPDMAVALAGVRDALEAAHGRCEAYYADSNWNPLAHVEITITVADVRRIYAALAMASGQNTEVQQPRE